MNTPNIGANTLAHTAAASRAWAPSSASMIKRGPSSRPCNPAAAISTTAPILIGIPNAASGKRAALVAVAKSVMRFADGLLKSATLCVTASTIPGSTAKPMSSGIKVILVIISRLPNT